MMAIQPYFESLTGARQVLPVRDRMRLFRRSRITAAGVMLAFFPLIAATSLEPTGLIGALVLFGILPAVIAMDVRRPASLDRAILLTLLAASSVLLAGTLRGLNGVSAVLLLAVLMIEGLLLSRTGSRKKILITGGCGLIALAISSGISEPVFGAGSWSVAASATAIVVNSAVLGFGILEIAQRVISSRTSLAMQTSEIESAMNEAVLTLDPTGSVLRISDNTERVLGIPASSFMGRGLVNLVLVSERPSFLTTVSHTSATRTNIAIRLHMRTSVAEGIPHYRWVALNISPSRTSSGQCIATLQDIDDAMREEERLKHIEAEAKKAESARSAFLATINHELRTPLNAIIGFSDILANPATIPHDAIKAREYAQLINTAGRDLHTMICAMIDMTRLEAGVYEIEKEPTEIRGLLKTVLDSFQDEPEGRDVSVTFEMPDKTLDIDMDARAMRSALQQLLSNASRFGGRGKPVNVSVKSDFESVMIAITDHGPGIPEEKLALLGKPFARLDETLNRNHGGIGLGLSLARGIAELHRGNLFINSTIGKGTTVVLSLPRAVSLSGIGAKAIAPANLIHLAKSRPEAVSTPLKGRRFA
jgi:two-component system, cell cycle sensor histidine kinase DivJ